MRSGFGWQPQPYTVRVEPASDGSTLIHSMVELSAYPRRVTDRLEYWAARTPDQVLVAQRGADGEWQRVKWWPVLPS